jgi:hypothetical protein
LLHSAIILGEQDDSRREEGQDTRFLYSTLARTIPVLPGWFEGVGFYDSPIYVEEKERY